MRFGEIGQQLRAYRLESGLRAEEIAARLGVSRAALYRYEKGEVIKLDTVQRLAELLKISPLSLLGIGVEYYSRPVGFFERVRQVEETADQILQLSGPLCYLTTSEAYDALLGEVFEDAANRPGADRGAVRALAEQVLGIMFARKRMYQMRRPGVIAMLTAGSVSLLLEQGVGGTAVPERLRRRAREVAAQEVEAVAALMTTEPMGLQFGVLTAGEPVGAFEILRSRDRATVTVNPFRPESAAVPGAGVAMVTSADEAVAAHQRVAEAMWRDSAKGAAGSAKLRELLAAHAG